MYKIVFQLLEILRVVLMRFDSLMKFFKDITDIDLADCGVNNVDSTS